MSSSLFTRKTALWGILALASSGVTLGQTAYRTNGQQYPIVGAPRGDQVHMQLALNPTNGFIVWEDNLTDGSGLGISARRVDGSLSGVLSSFRVNQITANDQERPQVTLLKNGGAAFVWQGGKQGFQNIYARFMTRSNTWVGNDVRVNTYTNKSKVNPAVARLADGNVIVVWGSFNQKSANSLQDIYGQRLSPTGGKLGVEFLVNQFTTYNQRSPAVASLRDGRFVVVWVSEQQRFMNGADLYARVFTASGSAVGSEFLINANLSDIATNVCANPTIAAGPNGDFLVAWGQLDLVVPQNGWEIMARPFSSALVGGAISRVNSYQYGDQYVPRLAAVGSDFLAVWSSMGQDGSREGVFGQFLRGDGTHSGTEMRINTSTASQQIHPTVASDGSNQFLVAWSSFVGLPSTFDLYAQRFTTDTEPLGTPAAPMVSVLSSNALSVTWPALAGFDLAFYEVYADGASTPTAATTNTWWTMNGLAPSSTHTFRLAYVLVGGRRSPLSEPASGRTYAAGATWGGIPQEWMTAYFGNDLFAWPSPYADSDGDGMSNLKEFLAGTDPNDPNSVLRLRLQPTAQGLFLNWNTQPGLVYQVQSSPNLGVWSNVGAPRFAAGNVDSLNVGGSNVGYYRVLRVR